ncbi:RHS repeat-associated core domain-containing protein [Micromonospora avicenniae]|uniref:RHS repeat-associated core domain-containing protein n=1 Tax=Micromonospora avicenniae TaxID=1198245 RepID=UPI001FE726EF|nr:RHS repeat-associated core domain-containing protein [Micromonospora avicenniae]
MAFFGRRVWRSALLAGGLSVALAVTGLGQPVQRAAAAPTWQPPTPKEAAGVRVRDTAPSKGHSDHASSQVATGVTQVQWPVGTSTADLGAAQTAAAKAQSTRAGLTGAVRARAGQLPVTISAPSASPAGEAMGDAVTSARVTVHDRKTTAKAGVQGLLISVSRADGKKSAGRTNLQVDYAKFAHAYGGDWTSRLRLVALPECALTTPDVAACQTRTPLSTANDTPDSLLSTNVSLDASAPTVLATQSGASGDSGDYTATSLSPAGQWEASNQTGDFSWSYPLRVPPSLGGPAPNISFSYSSGSIDGETALTNNQGSWIGDGWDSWPGFIERKYQSCVDDNPDHKTGDLCWFGDNATLSLNGHAGELIKDGAVWRLRNDDGTRVEKLTDSARGNGDDDNEYWKVTTTDGVQYYFGYHKLPGWSSDNPVTDSVWTVPVFGNNSGEPCYDSTFADAYCSQAWRWNLDYVVDPNSNSMAYFYGKETGAYGRDLDPDKRTTYDRGGYLKRVEYGMRKNAEYAQAAPLRVVFTTAERCLSNCWTGEAWTSDPVTAQWYDTPWDQYCKVGDKCTTQGAPTFWTARRLAKVTTQTRNGTTSYADVESWSLRHEFINAGTGESTPMWLRGITHAGHVTTAGGTAVSEPEITFDTGAQPLPNRVDGPADQRSALNRWRIKTVHTDTGGDIIVTYSGPDCTRSTLPSPATNTKRCMPSFYAPGGQELSEDWFHKYVVTRIDLDDTVTDQPTEVIEYDYDTPAWAYNKDELTKDKYRTWSDWRGYGKVTVRHGDPAGQQTSVEYRYLRGLDGDKAASGVKDVQVTDSWGGTIEDHEALQGFELQTITYNGRGGAETSSTRNDPLINGPTATRSRNGITTRAWMTNTDVARSRTVLAGGGYRYAKTVTSFNSDGMPTSVEDQGDESVTSDDSCTRTTYAPNDNIWMIDRVSQTETLSGRCPDPQTSADPATVLNRSRTFYDTYVDANSFGQAPTRGNVVRTEELEKFTGSTPVYTRTTTTTYDANGRPKSVTDPRGYTSTTDYTTANGGLVTQTVATNAKGHTLTSTIEPAWGSPTKVVDANGAVTDLTYDGLGRITSTWVPGRNKATQTPSTKFTYQVRKSGGPTAVTSEALLPAGTAYRKSVNLYDGFLRLRQTQLQATGGGRTITETLSNSLGTTAWTSAPYYDETNTAVSTSLATPQGQIPSITKYAYDGAGRQTAQILQANGAEKWRTTTVYDGERVSKIPPAGGTATTTITDAQGRTVNLRQYKNRADVGRDDPTTFDTTSYTYTPLGQRASVTDVTGANVWSYTYDLRGRQTKATDPDKGTTTTTYDAAGNVETTTSPLGAGDLTVGYNYDELGRKTAMRDDSLTGRIRADWVYDTAPNGKGKLASTNRYSGGNTYTTKIDAYDTYGRPTSTSVVLPAAESGLCAAASPNTCTYTTTTTYRANGQPNQITMPAAADLPSEKLTVGYTDVGDAAGTLSAAQIYVYDVTYNKLGQLTQFQLGDYGKRVTVTSDIDEPTRRLTSSNIVPELKPEAANFSYRYDDAGNVTEIHDTPTGGVTDHQCFALDYLQRLTEAWTPEGGSCAVKPTAWSQVDGSAYPYWHTWTFDATGNRKTEVRHGGTDMTYAYTYPAAGAARPHAVTTVTASGGATWTRNYTYDTGGNTKTRPTSTGATQTLTWDREGKILTSTDSTTTRYLQDADGNRLIRTDATGKTLYLPGGTEVRYTTSNGTKAATRYYSFAGQTIAIRTAGSLNWIVSDHHGTAELAINATNLAVARRRTLPYGEQRGATTGTWAAGMDKGFVGGTQDPTGLTHLGAREYDTFAGRFISVDPIIDLADPQQWNGYNYANNNPATLSDPSGLRPDCGNGGGMPTCDNTAPVAPGADNGPSGGWSDNYSNHHAPASTPPKNSGGGHGPTPAKPSTGYSYTYYEELGQASQIGSAEHAMDVFKANPEFVFPFQVDGCPEFKDGEICTLHPGPAIVHGVGDVYVTTTDTSVKFTVVSDKYFDARGSTITFSVVEKKGDLYLSQHAEASETKLAAGIGVKAGYARQNWNDQAHNLRVLLRSTPSHPSIDWTSPTDLTDLATGNWHHWF